jgi:hypothetical protein
MKKIEQEVLDKQPDVKLFKKIDTNDDNSVDFAEYKTYRLTIEPAVTDPTLQSEIDTVESDGQVGMSQTEFKLLYQ